MAIDLPPTLPAQLMDAAQVAQYANGRQEYVGTVTGYELRVTGDHYLSDDELARIFETAKSPSQAILLISSATARKGHLLVNTLYAPQQNVVYVHAIQATVAGVEGPAEITPYFKGLKGDNDLKRSEFDRDRVMANIRSQRSGVNYTVNYQVSPEDPASVTLMFAEAPVEDHDSTDLILQLGNQGSRFVGRYFADAGLTHNFKNGTHLAFGYETALTALGDAREGDNYQQFQLKLDHPFAAGLYGIDGSYVEYDQEVSGTTTVSSAGLCFLGVCVPGSGSTTTVPFEADLDAAISRIGLNGEQVLSSDIDRRFNLFERVETVDSQIEASTGEDVQDENYTTLEVGAKYYRINNLGGRSLNWNLGLSVKGGLTGDSGTLGTYDEFAARFMTLNPGAPVPTVVVSQRTAEFILYKPRLSVRGGITDKASLGLNVSGQIADEQLPQQQQWVLGGINGITAYLPGILVGDTGYFAKADYEYKVDFDRAVLKFGIFAEYGAAEFENASGADGDQRTITDAGLSLTLELGSQFEIRAAAARALTDDNFDDEFLDDNEADFFVVLKAEI